MDVYYIFVVIAMSVLVFEQWCKHDPVRVTIDDLLLEASGFLPSSVRNVLQVQGEPFQHDGQINFIYLHSELELHGKAYAVVADPACLPFMPNQFDVVFALFPYETLGTDVRWIEEAVRVLADHGLFVVIGINPLSLDGICDRLGMKRYPAHSHVVNPFYAQENILKHGLDHVVRLQRGLPWRNVSCASAPTFRVGGSRDMHRAGWFGDWQDGMIMLDIYQRDFMEMELAGLAVI